MARRQAGFCRLSLGELQGRQDYETAIDFYERLAARNPERIWLRRGLLETLDEYARFLRGGSVPGEADTTLRRAIEVAESLADDPEAGKPCYAPPLVAAFRDLARDLTGVASDPSWESRAARLVRQADAWEAAAPSTGGRAVIMPGPR